MTSKVTQARLPCPNCPSSDAYHVYDDGHGYCFSCQYRSASKTSIPREGDFTYEPLPWRAVSRSTMQFYGVLSRVAVDGKPISIGYRYPNGDLKVRSLSKKEFHWVKSGSKEPVGLFGQDKFTPGGHKYVTVTEGELDALSLYQVLGGPVVSVQSSSTAASDCANCRSWLNSYERIYLAFDNDANGRDATKAVAKLFNHSKVFHVKFGHRKDANEYLQNGEADLLKNIWWNAKKYLPDNMSSTLEEFKTALSSPPKYGAPYPLSRLTDMTYGIRTGETVLVTAQEKVGKTEFMHAILHKLLKETDDDTHVGGLFLEEPKQRTLQALAGIELGRAVHLPDQVPSNMEVIEAVNKVVRIDDRLYLYSHSGSGDPDDVLDTLRFLATACSCKYIIWDHPGMDVFGLGIDNERLALDYLATKSARLAHELDFGLIVVCHVNDLGQIRGSRYFGKTCDLRIDLTRDTSNPDPSIRNLVNITIPYGRFCYKSGPVGSYLFNPLTQRYTEAANDNDPYANPKNKAA